MELPSPLPLLKCHSDTFCLNSSLPCSTDRVPRTSADFYRFCEIILQHEAYEADNDVESKMNVDQLEPKKRQQQQKNSNRNKSKTKTGNLTRTVSSGDKTTPNGVPVNKKSPKNQSSSATFSDESDIDEGTYYSVSCFCGKPFAGRPMIECTSCLTWIHLGCAKVRRNKIPDKYFCYKCRYKHLIRSHMPAYGINENNLNRIAPSQPSSPPPSFVQSTSNANNTAFDLQLIKNFNGNTQSIRHVPLPVSKRMNKLPSPTVNISSPPSSASSSESPSSYSNTIAKNNNNSNMKYTNKLLNTLCEHTPCDNVDDFIDLQNSHGDMFGITTLVAPLQPHLTKQQPSQHLKVTDSNVAKSVLILKRQSLLKNTSTVQVHSLDDGNETDVRKDNIKTPIVTSRPKAIEYLTKPSKSYPSAIISKRINKTNTMPKAIRLNLGVGVTTSTITSDAVPAAVVNGSNNHSFNNSKHKLILKHGHQINRTDKLHKSANIQSIERGLVTYHRKSIADRL